MSSRPRSRIVAALVIVGSIASVATSKRAIVGRAPLPAITLDAEHPTAAVRVRAELRDAYRVPNPRLTATIRVTPAASGSRVRARLLGAASRQVLGEATSDLHPERIEVSGAIWDGCERKTTCVDEVLVEVELVDRAARVVVDGMLEAYVPHGQEGDIRLDVARDP